MRVHFWKEATQHPNVSAVLLKHRTKAFEHRFRCNIAQSTSVERNGAGASRLCVKRHTVLGLNECRTLLRPWRAHSQTPPLVVTEGGSVFAAGI